MLRLPEFTLTRPKRLDAAIAILAEHGENALPIARLFGAAHQPVTVFT